ncbi:MAG: protein-disulfide reductase DsbD N-terminal domain-containing protein [Betaproteobacteria bacterium]|nr:protein-disulfide reductase DsbD N-terminal domain-containing protein [Betaproteobacteria bacterium]
MIPDIQVRTGARLAKHVILTLLPLVLGAAAFAAAREPELLEPERAFRISTWPLDERNVEVRFEIADGYYMYRDRFRFETMRGRVLADVALPRGKVKDDPFFGRTEIYRRDARIRVPVTDEDWDRGTVKLKVTSQGCADIGVCYTPLEQIVEFRITGNFASAVPRRASQAPARLAGAQQVTWSALAQQRRSHVEPWIFPALLLAFFLAGLAASFVRYCSVARSGPRRPVENDFLRVAVRLLIYTVLGGAAGIASNAVFENFPGTTRAILAVAFGSLSIVALTMPRAAVAVATAGALLLVARSGNALLGAAGMALLALSLGFTSHLARWQGTPAAARPMQLTLGLTAAALAIWTASPLIAGPVHGFAWGRLLTGG